MIEFLAGVVRKESPTGMVLECGGVGYGVQLTLPTMVQLPSIGEAFQLWIYTRVREDGINLYGFISYEERKAFEVLIQVNGVGPKVAMAILSTINLAQLRDTVINQRDDILTLVPGIGKRTAEKIIVELKGKIEQLPKVALNHETAIRPGKIQPLKLEDAAVKQHDMMRDDLQSALANLGFKDKQILAVIDALGEEDHHLDFSLLIKKALMILRGDVRELSSPGRKEVKAVWGSPSNLPPSNDSSEGTIK